MRQRHRTLDLIRICYKLSWPDRERFVACYEAAQGRAMGPLWRWPFRYYDTKQKLKKSLRGKRRKRRK